MDSSSKVSRSDAVPPAKPRAEAVDPSRSDKGMPLLWFPPDNDHASTWTAKNNPGFHGLQGRDCILILMKCLNLSHWQYD